MDIFSLLLPFLLDLLSNLDCLNDSDAALVRRARRRGPLMFWQVRGAIKAKTELRGRAVGRAAGDFMDEVAEMGDREMLSWICEARRIKAKREAE